MTPEERAAIEARITELARKLKARANHPEYRENVLAIDAALTELRKRLADG